MYLFFDTETAGLPNDYNAPVSDSENWPRLVQLAWILADADGREIRKCEMIVRPDGFEIPASATEVHGITTERAREEGVALGAVLQTFESDFHRAHTLVGHNYSFDRSIVSAEFHRIGRDDLFKGKRARCTMRQTATWCGIPGRYGPKWPSLQELHDKLFGLGFIGSHAAGADVAATAKCFFELIRRRVFAELET
jgi:DNA polymerase-3 subunit epsilon